MIKATFDSMDAVKAAYAAGSAVHWRFDSCKLRRDAAGQWWVDCSNGFTAPLSGDDDFQDFYCL